MVRDDDHGDSKRRAFLKGTAVAATFGLSGFLAVEAATVAIMDPAMVAGAKPPKPVEAKLPKRAGAKPPNLLETGPPRRAERRPKPAGEKPLKPVEVLLELPLKIP